MKYEKAEQMNSIDEFDQKIKIDPLKTEETSATPRIESPQSDVRPQVTSLNTQLVQKPEAKSKKKKKTKEKQGPTEAPFPVEDISRHQPDEIEGIEGFIGRRPLKDPFRAGERVTHEVTYFGMLAGSLVFSVEPFTLVNGRKSYEFSMRARTRSVFNAMYAADDTATNLVDFETLVPTAFFLHVKESKQLEETRALFDTQKKTATLWQKRKTLDNPEENKKKEWSIPDFSQNVFSAVFYMRTFPWKEGDERAFRVTDNEENLIFKAKVLRFEKLKTAAGVFDSIVLKPEVHLRGVAKPVGDLFIWLSNDDRRYILRIEAKIKIGSFISEIVELEPGLDSTVDTVPLKPEPSRPIKPI